MITLTEKALVATLPGLVVPLSSLQAVQTVRSHVSEDDVNALTGKGASLINKLLGTDMTLPSLLTGVDPKVAGQYELMLAQAVVEIAVKTLGETIDPELIVSQAKDHVVRLLTSPAHAWMFARADATAATGEMKAVVEGVDVQVATKVAADGSVVIKKGGKGVLAEALYTQYVESLNGQPYNNQAFIAILVEKLGMTKPGATTYNYNMKTKFGGAITAKGKK